MSISHVPSKYRLYPLAEDYKRWLERLQGKYNSCIPSGLVERIRNRIVEFNEATVVQALTELNETRYHVYKYNIVSILCEEPQPLPLLDWETVHEVIYLLEEIRPAIHQLPTSIIHMVKVVQETRKNRMLEKEAKNYVETSDSQEEQITN